MDRIAIVGGAPLNGSIPISGAKNSAIKLMAASLLTDQPLRLTNMPRLADTRFLARLLRRLRHAADLRIWRRDHRAFHRGLRSRPRHPARRAIGLERTPGEF